MNDFFHKHVEAFQKVIRANIFSIHKNFLICIMPHYRIHIKLDGQEVREFIIEDPRTNIEYVYQEYKKRVNAKNGTGRVIYFDLVMIAEASLTCEDDRKEVFNPGNNFGVEPVKPVEIKRKKQNRNYESRPTLGERMRK